MHIDIVLLYCVHINKEKREKITSVDNKQNLTASASVHPLTVILGFGDHL